MNKNRLNKAFSIVASLMLVLTVSGCGVQKAVQTNESSSFTTFEKENKEISDWDIRKAPNYFLVDGKAQIDNDVPEKGEIKYSNLDSLGRAGKAVGNLTYKDNRATAKARGRQKFDADVKDLAGWGHNEEVAIKLSNGKTYHGWFWNRSHLIADSLGGAPDVKNLVTGTRMQNVGDNGSNPGGMAYPETMVRSYLDSNRNSSVIYQVTPVYKGKELVPRVVLVDVKSSDKAIDLHIIVYNAANGYKINYSNGTFQAE